MSTMEKQRAGPVLAPGRSRRSFAAEFKADAVSLVLDEGRSSASVARSLGIGATNLRNWVRQARIDRGEREGVTTSEQADLAELRRENFLLRQERLLRRHHRQPDRRLYHPSGAQPLRVSSQAVHPQPSPRS